MRGRRWGGQRGKERSDKPGKGSGTKEVVLANAEALGRSILEGPRLSRRAALEKTRRLSKTWATELAPTVPNTNLKQKGIRKTQKALALHI